MRFKLLTSLRIIALPFIITGITITATGALGLSELTIKPIYNTLLLLYHFYVVAYALNIIHQHFNLKVQ